MTDAAGPTSLRLALLSAARLARQPRAWRDAALGGVCFGATEPTAPAPLLCVDMPVLGAADAACEIWHAASTTQAGQDGPIHYRHDGRVLFGQCHLPEAETGAHGPSLAAGTEAAYAAIFDLLDRLGYPNALRFWNFFAGINAETHGLERYRQFNIGRYRAFEAHDRATTGNVPAACALGSHGGGLAIAFLATRTPVEAIENPRQISAYRYPQDYGPRSPTFARAGLARLGDADLLFVSGTASIVGHRTLHADDVAAQTREALANIDAVLSAANARAPARPYSLDSLCYKVFIRRAADLPTVRRELEAAAGPAARAIYLHADVCRADLLVEIEASGGHAVETLTEQDDIHEAV
jgi:enamine deaminase RidA (YjgF/YER057c/UK114 family)